MSVDDRRLIVGVLLLALAACSAQAPGDEASRAHAAGVAVAEGMPADVVDPADDAVVDAEATSAAATPPKETCEGALDCTFFGVGAILAAPFWVLGAFLGLVF